MTDPRQLVQPTADYTLLFPGSWLALPFSEDDQQLRERIKRTVTARVGRDDRLARQRRGAVDDLLATAQQARQTGADAMYLAMEILPGVPFPGSLVTIDDRWPAAGGTFPREDRAAALAAAFPGAEIVEHRMGPVARVQEVGSVTVGEEELPSARSQFWIPSPDSDRLLVITVSAPMAADVDLWLTLFDSIVDSLTWRRSSQETSS